MGIRTLIWICALGVAVHHLNLDSSGTVGQTVPAPSSTYNPAEPGEQPYAELIEQAGTNHGVDPALIAGLCHVESGWQPDVINGTRTSNKGAIGICQFMPPTAQAMGVNPTNPASAIDGTARYLANSYRIHGNWRETIAAYNAGDPAVTRQGESAADGPYVNNVIRQWERRR